MSLFKKHDASSFFHEFAHISLKAMHDFVKSGKADDVYMKDWKVLQDWLGAKKGVEEFTVGQHEKFARGFEAYLREGKAPIPELVGSFERIKTWLSNVYKNAQSLKVELSPEIRQFMDGMFKMPDEFNQAPNENRYVLNRPFEPEMGVDEKSTSSNIKNEYLGQKEEQVVRGNQLAEEMRKNVDDKVQEKGMTIYSEANGDLERIAEALHNPLFAGDKFKEWREAMQASLDLSPEAKAELAKGQQYYREAGQVSQENGVIKELRDNYSNRLYKTDKEGDYIKTERNAALRQSTSHAKQRVFESTLDAMEAYAKGETKRKPATLSYPDLLSIHNEEMARVNKARQMATFQIENGVGAWKKERPEGWEQVGNLEKNVPIKDKNGEAVIGEDGNQAVSHSKFYAPAGIAKGLGAITDPDFIQKIDTLSTMKKYQGMVKTINLGLFSYFHHWNFVKATLSNGGISTLIKAIHMDAELKSDYHKYWEQDLALHLGKTPLAEDVADVLRNLTEKNGDTFSKITNLPIVKQALERTDKNADFLFRKGQRFLKVSEYARQVSNWMADHPTATDAELKAAKEGFASHADNTYGGQNWQAMGMTKSNLSLLRLAFLAPDWFTSNNKTILNMFSRGTEGMASRKFMLTGMLGGLVITEGLNKMLTGHFTDENKKGHGLDVEFSPDVYVNFFPPPVAEAIKMYSMVREHGPLIGATRYAQGKLGPFGRTALGALKQTDYSGRPIKTTVDMLRFLLTSATPIPIVAGNLVDYLQTEPNKTLRGTLAVATGLGRYSRSGKSYAKVTPKL